MWEFNQLFSSPQVGNIIASQYCCQFPLVTTTRRNFISTRIRAIVQPSFDDKIKALSANTVINMAGFVWQLNWDGPDRSEDEISLLEKCRYAALFPTKAQLVRTFPFHFCGQMAASRLPSWPEAIMRPDDFLTVRSFHKFDAQSFDGSRRRNGRRFRVLRRQTIEPAIVGFDSDNSICERKNWNSYRLEIFYENWTSWRFFKDDRPHLES